MGWRAELDERFEDPEGSEEDNSPREVALSNCDIPDMSVLADSLCNGTMPSLVTPSLVTLDLTQFPASAPVAAALAKATTPSNMSGCRSLASTSQ